MTSASRSGVADPGRRSTKGGLAKAALVAALLAVTACLAAPAAAYPTDDEVRARPSHDRVAPTRFVVAIAVDGLNPDAIRQLGRDGAPSFYRMIDDGAGTLNARTAYERTITLPNHTGMFTGRRVLGGRGHHVTMDHDPGGTVQDLAGYYVASFFDVVHDHGGRTALFATKDKFAFYHRTWSGNGAQDRVGDDDGRDKIDKFQVAGAGRVVDKVIGSLQGLPRMVNFVHIALPDAAGHAYGFMSPRYVRAVARTDVLLGRILDTIRGSKDLRSTVDVVLTADHGGRGDHGHSVATDEDNYTIPFLTWGVDVASGRDLYALNPDRTSPRHGRPGYGGSPPIRNTDMASLVTRLLSLPEVPGALPHTDPLHVS